MRPLLPSAYRLFRHQGAEMDYRFRRWEWGGSRLWSSWPLVTGGRCRPKQRPWLLWRNFEGDGSHFHTRNGEPKNWRNSRTGPRGFGDWAFEPPLDSAWLRAAAPQRSMGGGSNRSGAWLCGNPASGRAFPPHRMAGELLGAGTADRTWARATESYRVSRTGKADVEKKDGGGHSAFGRRTKNEDGYR